MKFSYPHLSKATQAIGRWLIGVILASLSLTAESAELGRKSSASPEEPATDQWRYLLALDDEALERILEKRLASRQTGTASPERLPSNLELRVLLAKSFRNLWRSHSEASRYLNAAQSHLTENSDEAAFAQALRCQIAHRRALASASVECAKLAALESEVEDLSVRAHIGISQSFYLSRNGKHEPAEAKARESATLAEQALDPTLTAITNSWLGVQYCIKHLPERALLHFETAWDAVKDLKNLELKQIIRFNSAWVYTDLNRHEEALAILEEAITWPVMSVASSNFLVAHAALARTLTQLGDAAQAEQNLNALIPNHLDAVEDDTKIQVYQALAESQLAQNKVELSIQTFEKAIALFDNSAPVPNPRGQAALVPYTGALREAGRLDEALQVIDAVIAQLGNQPPNNLLRKALLQRAAVLRQKGQADQATAASAEAANIAKQLESEALNYQISRLKVAIELEQTNRELALARQREAALKESARKETMLRWLMLLLSALVLAVAYLLFVRHLQRRIHQAERAANEQLEDKVRLRTEQLEEQMAERLQAEVERRHLLGKLAEGEKMRALGQLTAGVAHDFNNLMTAVALTTEFLKSSDNRSKQARDTLLDDILSATDSAARITGGLLAYARQQPLQPKILQLDEFLEESTLIFKNTLGERNTLKTSYEPCAVKVDQGQLASALLNLVLNAKEAIGDRGVVELELTRRRDPKSDAELAVISVNDSGRGMTRDDLKRATEPFYTTKPTGEGAGLGLSMVYGFAHQSGGDLTLSSDTGAGTRVELRLPIVKSQTGNDGEQSFDRLQTLPKDLNVLVVEDRESVRTMLKRSLEHLEQAPVTACSADEAKLAMEAKGPPDILLTDIMMPGELDGHQLAAWARDEFPALPVILMSGYSENVTGEFAFLRKPFNIETLEQTLLAALQQFAEQRLRDSEVVA